MFYLLNGSEHIYKYRNLDLDDEVHSIWVIWTSDLQESKGQAFLVLPLPAALISATLVGVIFRKKLVL